MEALMTVTTALYVASTVFLVAMCLRFLKRIKDEQQR
jgi:hypothetical protein